MSSLHSSSSRYIKRNDSNISESGVVSSNIINPQSYTCYPSYSEPLLSDPIQSTNINTKSAKKLLPAQRETPTSQEGQTKPMSRIKVKMAHYVNANYGVVFIKSIKKTTTVDVIKKAFLSFGKLKFIQLPFNKCKGKNIGYGYVIFSSPSTARHLVENVKEMELDGKMVKLFHFEEKPESIVEPSKRKISAFEKTELDMERVKVSRMRTGSHQTLGNLNSVLEAPASALLKPEKKGGNSKPNPSLQRDHKEPMKSDCRNLFHACKPTQSSFKVRACENHRFSNLVFRINQRSREDDIL